MLSPCRPVLACWPSSSRGLYVRCLCKFGYQTTTIIIVSGVTAGYSLFRRLAFPNGCLLAYVLFMHVIEINAHFLAGGHSRLDDRHTRSRLRGLAVRLVAYEDQKGNTSMATVSYLRCRIVSWLPSVCIRLSFLEMLFTCVGCCLLFFLQRIN